MNERVQRLVRDLKEATMEDWVEVGEQLRESPMLLETLSVVLRKLTQNFSTTGECVPQPLFRVTLEGVGAQPAVVMSVLQAHTTCTMTTVREIMEKAPCVVWESRSWEKCTKLVDALARAGAQANVQSVL